MFRVRCRASGPTQKGIYENSNVVKNQHCVDAIKQVKEETMY